MKVICLTTRGVDKASTQYRLVQFLEMFRVAGVTLDFTARDALNHKRIAGISTYDLVVNQRCPLPLLRARAVRQRARRMLVDFDDAIYTRPGPPWSWLTRVRVRVRLHYLLAHADVTTVANGHLALYARRHAKRVEIVPMALDGRIWHPVENRPAGSQVQVGWNGSPTNLPQLERLGGVLAPLFNRRRDLRLKVLCGRRPDLPFAFEHQPFQAGAEPEFVRSLDIGLLPLVEDEFTRGKSPIKALQYLACRIPVVGDCFGGTAEMLDESNSLRIRELADWPRALESLADDRDCRQRLGAAGCERFQARHELRVVGRSWLALFRGEII